MGFIVAPKAVYPKLLQAKQAADLHSPGFNQRLIFEVMQNGFLDRHVPTIRSLYKAQRDAMLQALANHFPESQGPELPAEQHLHLEHTGRRHVLVGALACRHERGGPAAPRRGQGRGLCARRAVLRRQRRRPQPCA